MTLATLATTVATAQSLNYPKAQKDGTVDEYFGVKVADPYRWLENDTSAQTAAWVEAENKVTNAYLQPSFPTTRRSGRPASVTASGISIRTTVCRTSM